MCFRCDVIHGKLFQAFPLVSLLNTQMRNSFNILQIGTQNIFQAMVSFKRIKVSLEAFNSLNVLWLLFALWLSQSPVFTEAAHCPSSEAVCFPGKVL
jgi:hypothetical protein